LQARQLMNGEGSSASVRLGLLEKAVALDPNFAEAWATLAWARIVHWRWNTNRGDPELREMAHQALDEAISLGPNLPHVPHAQSSFVLIEDNDLETSIDYLLKALSIDPSFSSSRRALGSRYWTLGRLSEAQHYMEEALSTDPRNSGTIDDLVSIYRVRNMWEKARVLTEAHMDPDQWQQYSLAYTRYLETGDLESFVKEGKRIEDKETFIWANFNWIDRDFQAAWLVHQNLDPDDWFVVSHYSPIGNWELQAALINFLIGDEARYLSESAKAIAKTRKVVENHPIAVPLNWSNLAIAYALKRDRAAMESAMAIAREKASDTTRKFRYQLKVELQIAMSYAIIGDNLKAIDTLEAASQLKSIDFFSRELALEPIFDRLRGNPRFDAFLED
jgi:tetratricopeptide (TPR) repeat protein